MKQTRLIIDSNITNYDYIKFNKNDNDVISYLSLKSNYKELKVFINDGIFSYNYPSNISYQNLFFQYFEGVSSVKPTYPEYKKFPLLTNSSKILIPRVLKKLNKSTVKPLLKEIDNDIEEAKEFCLLFLSQLVSSFYYYDNDERFTFKNLNSNFLKDLFTKKNDLYKEIIHILTELELIQCDYKFIVGQKSYGYRITPDILKKGLEEYQLKTKYAIKYNLKKNLKLMVRNEENIIAKNLMKFYEELTFPSIEEVWDNGKKLAKAKTNINGKKIIYRNKHTKSYYKNRKTTTFVEESVLKYEYLILRREGLKIPKPGPIECGGRVYDSLNLLPKWIRKMIKYKGEYMIELDYTCLHPNIATTLYQGTQDFITHQKIAEQTNLSLQVVKKANLGLFNTENRKMIYNPVYSYYINNDYDMMTNIMVEKSNNDLEDKHKHKITSYKMFAKEVEIMTEAIKQLNEQNIYVMYVFDALYCHPNDVLIVKEIMNKVVLQLGVKTSVK